MTRFDVVEKSIAQLREALQTGAVTSVQLVEQYLERIRHYDSTGIKLNSIVELNASALAEAAESDARRAAGELLGKLDGIPFTAKDSYMVEGMTVAAGSPAFANLMASKNAFSIQQLKNAGAVFIGLTNMPPMANGGMQRGLYGRAESPYNADFLTSAFASGSSNGSGTATAASFAAFGLGEETWSSGRAPAACNALCAYTPSRGLISTRGNWPLVPTMDVVVPHTRSMADMFEVLDVLMVDDTDVSGDLWRMQPWIKLPKPSDVKNAKVVSRLRGLRVAAPKMFLGNDELQGSGTGMGSVTGQKIQPRLSSMVLWNELVAKLTYAGVEVVETDFPLVTNYEADRAGAPNVFNRGIVPNDFFDFEIWDLSIWSWNAFLKNNSQPGLNSITDVVGENIFPQPAGALRDRYAEFDFDPADYVARAKEHGVIDPFDDAHAELLRAGLEALEKTRRIDLDDWLADGGFAAAIFPTLADVAPADSDVNSASADIAWQNGVWVANGNLAIRHLGVPTVTIPMGLASDIGMPFGLTLAGAAYSDMKLLDLAAQIEALGPTRPVPPRTPSLLPEGAHA